MAVDSKYDPIFIVKTDKKKGGFDEVQIKGRMFCAILHRIESMDFRKRRLEKGPSEEMIFERGICTR